MAEPIAPHDGSNGLLWIAALRQQGNKFLEIGNGINFGRDRLEPEAPVEVAANRGMESVSRHLADSINLSDNFLEAHQLADRFLSNRLVETGWLEEFR